MSKKKNRSNRNNAKNNTKSNAKKVTGNQTVNKQENGNAKESEKHIAGKAEAVQIQELVSVIVPIYQVEAYLKRSVDSVLNQTYRNLEVILVDDGSTDQCGKICDEYAQKDNRVVVIHKENGGLSDARNAGLDRANGDYIVFTDSDDYIAPDFVETLLSELKKENADVAMCSYTVTEGMTYDDSIFKEQKDRHEADGSVEVCDREQLLNNLYDANHRDATYFIVSWNKLYKASLWRDVRFPKGKIHEDEATTYKIYDKAKKGVYLHKPLYGYFSAPESITRAKFYMKRLDWMDALDDRITYFEERKKQPDSLSDKAKIVFWDQQIANARLARADAAIHYYYPLKEEFPAEREAAKRLKDYVREQRGAEKRPGYLLFRISAPLYRLVTNIDRDKKERLYQLAFVLLFAWLAFLCFYKLDVKYVDPWDESRHGVNAYEMLKQGNLIKNTYLYETDYYNLKPPLSMWTIMLSMLLVGKSIFAMRLPSVICYLLLAFVAACFARKRYGRIPSLLILAFLAANTTPFLAHMVRTGDADSLYVLLFSLAMLSMIQIGQDHRKLYTCGFLFALAFLTKSFHAGVIVIIGVLFLLLTGEFLRIKLSEYVKFVLSFAIPLLLWAGLRYRMDGTAFLEQMWLTDVLGRSQSGFGSNEAGFTYYFSYFLGNMSGKLQIYLFVLIGIVLGGILLFFTKEKKADKNRSKKIFGDALGFSLWILVPALAFSAIRTKLLWYQYPVITAILIVGAIVIGRVVETRKLPVVCRGAVLVAAVALSVYFGRDLFMIFSGYGVNGNQTNDFQLLLQDTAACVWSKEIISSETNQKETLLCCAYQSLQTDDKEHPINTVWAQQDVFVAEAYGDYYCVNGGAETLLADMLLESAPNVKVQFLLFTTKMLYDTYTETLSAVGLDDLGYEMTPVASRGEYIAVTVKK